jgi:hypothetical protein
VIDPDLDAILADLKATQLGGFLAVTVIAGTKQADGLLDGGDEVVADGTGQRVQIALTVVRVRNGVIPLPVRGDTMTIRTEQADASGAVTTVDTDYHVREIRDDPQQNGLWIFTLAPV